MILIRKRNSWSTNRLFIYLRIVLQEVVRNSRAFSEIAFDDPSYSNYMVYIERHSSQFTSLLASSSIITNLLLILSPSYLILSLFLFILSVISCLPLLCLLLFSCLPLLLSSSFQIILMSIIGSSKSRLSGLLSSQ